MFALQTEDERQYYKGKTYKVNFETYPSYTSNKEDAKKYKHKKIAEKSCESLNNKLEYDQFKVVEA